MMASAGAASGLNAGQATVSARCVLAESTSDVDLFRGLAARFGLREVWVTNGMYTGVVASQKLLQFSGRE